MKYSLNTTVSTLTRAVRACAAVVPSTPSKGRSERLCMVRLEVTAAGLLVLSGTDRVMFVRAYVEDGPEDEHVLDTLATLKPTLPLPVWLGIVSELGVQAYAHQSPDMAVSLEFIGHSDESLSVHVATDSWARTFDTARLETYDGTQLFKRAHALAELRPRLHMQTYSRSVFLRLGKLIDLSEPTDTVQLRATGNTDQDPVLVHIIGDTGTWCEVAVKPLTGADDFGGL